MKHKEPHKLDIVCFYCVREKCIQLEKLLKFVKKVMNNLNFNQTDNEGLKALVDFEHEAYELLKEIGEIE